MKVGKWLIGRNNSTISSISDNAAIERVQMKRLLMNNNNTKLVGIAIDGKEHTWTLDEEIKEMKGHLFGFIRTIYGREMIDARKLAIFEDVRLGR